MPMIQNTGPGVTQLYSSAQPERRVNLLVGVNSISQEDLDFFKDKIALAPNLHVMSEINDMPVTVEDAEKEAEKNRKAQEKAEAQAAKEAEALAAKEKAEKEAAEKAALEAEEAAKKEADDKHKGHGKGHK